jgi:hypothetical protein
MAIYMFASKLKAGVFAFTRDPTGAGLPLEYAPWHALGRQALTGAGGVDTATVVSRILRGRRHYLVQADRPDRVGA